MEDKKAANILISLLEKHAFNEEEKEAIREAIGILGWTSLSKSRLNAKKARLDKSAKW